MASPPDPSSPLTPGGSPAPPIGDTEIQGPGGAGPPAPPGPARVGIPGYEILSELGRGGMGVVYKARQTTPNRLVALKMILPGEYADERERARFLAEAEAVAQLQHPNIVQVYEVGECDGRPFLVLEYLEGGSLAERVRDTPWPPRDAAALVETLARAVHAAHQKQIVHRDLKPANVLLAADGTPKVGDFGLAKRMDAGEGLSQAGQVMGTPSYMPPEQAAGRTGEIGPVSDVYSLGAILYTLLTGRPPFRGPTPEETRRQVLANEPAPPRRLQSNVPVDLDTVCLKCLEKGPEHRYGSALELAEELRRFLAGEPVRARPVGTLERGWKWARRRPALAAAYVLLAAALLLGIGGGGATWLWLRAEKARGDAEAAESALKEAKRLLTQVSYADQMDLALREWDAGRVKRARKLLEEAGDLQEELTPGRRPWEWEFLNRVVHPELAVLEGHTDAVTCVAFSPDGRRVVTASQDATARLWDADSGKQRIVLGGHANWVTSAAFSPDGGRVVTASLDGTARVWDADTGKQLTVAGSSSNPIFSVAFSPDGGRIAAAGWDKMVRLWDAASGEQLSVLEGHTGAVFSVAFSPDGGRIAAASADGTALIWDAASGKRLTVVEGGAQGVYSVAFSPDGARVATASADGTARLGRGLRPAARRSAGAHEHRL